MISESTHGDIPGGTPSTSTIRSPRRWRRMILMVYAVLLFVSHIVRLVAPDNSPRPDQRTIEVSVVQNDTVGERPVSIAYVDTGSAAELRTGQSSSNLAAGANLPVLVLLHGSPVASISMMGLHNALARTGKYRVITPDLPGFAGSSFPVPDYSVRAHARYVYQLLDSLHVHRAHFIAYSMSGGVVIENSRIAASRIASITLLSAIGVQEMELMGDYNLNHAVHGVQLAFLWLIQEGFPHFGWMDDAIIDTGYARNFYDTDQRPLREALLQYEGPLQIIHGIDDPLVPFRAAQEHERIVPQSELHAFKTGGHGLVFSSADTLGSLIESFVDRAESGTAVLRKDASRERVVQAELPFDNSGRPPATGMALAVLCALIVITSLVSEDLACIGAGLFAAAGTISFSVALAASFGGIVVGDVLIYVAGRTLGYRIATIAPLKWFLSRDRLERGEQWFNNHGMKLIFTSRFIPGTRFATYFSAGVMKAPFRTFLLYFLIAASIWTPIIVGAAMAAGSEFWEFYRAYESYAFAALIAFLIILYLVVQVIPSTFTYRGRRLLLSRWYRVTNWEFWPLPVFYFPVALYVLWLGIRHRSFTLFTAANPGIPHGGFVGESKTSILNALQPGCHVPEFAEIPTESNPVKFVDNFMTSHGLDFPIVLKPVAGERGHDVKIVRSSDDVKAYFRRRTSPTIIQKFAPGHEFGVFYYRFPDEENGHIFSITDKKQPNLVGDGSQSIEHLILEDPGAVRMAAFHLEQFADELDRVPAAGECVPLVEIGTHSRGALFLDATGMASASFEAAIDRAAKVFDGFYFGRFDVRIPGENPLGDGVKFKIIELNGVTSEATHIYDPAVSLLDAYRTLFTQWRLAFEIGAANSSRGAAVTPARELLSLLFARFRTG